MSIIEKMEKLTPSEFAAQYPRCRKSADATRYVVLHITGNGFIDQRVLDLEPGEEAVKVGHTTGSSSKSVIRYAIIPTPTPFAPPSTFKKLELPDDSARGDGLQAQAAEKPATRSDLVTIEQIDGSKSFAQYVQRHEISTLRRLSGDSNVYSIGDIAHALLPGHAIRCAGIVLNVRDMVRMTVPTVARLLAASPVEHGQQALDTITFWLSGHSVDLDHLDALINALLVPETQALTKHAPEASAYLLKAIRTTQDPGKMPLGMLPSRIAVRMAEIYQMASEAFAEIEDWKRQVYLNKERTDLYAPRETDRQRSDIIALSPLYATA